MLKLTLGNFLGKVQQLFFPENLQLSGVHFSPSNSRIQMAKHQAYCQYAANKTSQLLVQMCTMGYTYFCKFAMLPWQLLVLITSL